MTPNDLEVLIHYYSVAAPHPRLHAPAVRDCIDRYLRDGILEPDAQRTYRTTQKGEKWLKAILSVPCPDTRKPKRIRGKFTNNEYVIVDIQDGDTYVTDGGLYVHFTDAEVIEWHEPDEPREGAYLSSAQRKAYESTGFGQPDELTDEQKTWWSDLPVKGNNTTYVDHKTCPCGEICAIAPILGLPSGWIKRHFSHRNITLPSLPGKDMGSELKANPPLLSVLCFVTGTRVFMELEPTKRTATITGHGLRAGDAVEIYSASGVLEGAYTIADITSTNTIALRGLAWYTRFYYWLKRPFVRAFPEWIY